MGYRGEEIEQPKPAGVVRVVCIGGSTTYTTGVDDYEQSYPDQLERKLTALGYKVDVINAGVPGWSSWESLVNFQLRVLDLDPDLIVVYDALNDVGPRIVWPPTAYRGDNSGARKLDSVEPTLVRALSLSTAARFALVKFGYGASQIGQESIAPTADTFLGDEFDVQSWTASYPAGIFDDHPVAEMIRANPPVYFERNVENLIATARSRGIGVVLATFAHLSAIHHDRHSSWDSPEYWSAIAEHNDVLRAIAARANVPVLDLARELPQDPALYAPISREGLNFVDIYHVNAAGAERQAQLLAEFLHRRTLVVGRSPGPVVGQGREAGPDSARRP